GVVLAVEAGDDRGALYALLDVAEQVRLSGGLDGVAEAEERPFHAIRALKFNLPLPGAGYVPAAAAAQNAWLYDPAYWDRFFSMMARNRYNTLTLWSAHPFPYLVRLQQYPDASPLSEAELARNQEMFRYLLQSAKAHGVDTYLITWNIHLPEAFARARGVRPAGEDSPLVRDYLRESIAALLREYPDLTGIGTCPGEQMPMNPEAKERFIEETYFAAMAQAGRPVSFIHRSWQGDPVAVREMLRRVKPRAPVFLDIKFSGEHLYSSPRPHVQDVRWLEPAPRDYRLLWHLRNDDLYTFRWGNPAFVRDTLRNAGGPGSAGYVVGSENLIPGPDRLEAPEAREHQDWTYEFERNWFSYALWGRLGYNPSIHERRWVALFRERFGSPGEEVYRALTAASLILPAVTAFHWNYMNGDWHVERCWGGWNTNYEERWGLPNWRDDNPFHSVEEFIWTHTIDDSLVPPLLYAARLAAGRPGGEADQRTPDQVADDLEKWAAQALAVRDTPPRRRQGEWKCMRDDLRAVAALGRYYAEKIRAAACLSRLLLSGRESDRADAVAHLRKAVAHWEDLSNLTAAHYAGGERTWRALLPEVQRDLEIAERMKPLQTMEEAWEVWEPSAPAAHPQALLKLAYAPERGERVTWQTRVRRRFVPLTAFKRNPWLARVEEILGWRSPEQSASLLGSLVSPTPRQPEPSARVGYLRATVSASGAGRGLFALPKEPACRAWVNGEPAARGTDYGGNLVLWSAPVRVGENQLLVKWARASARHPALLAPPPLEGVLPEGPTVGVPASRPDRGMLRAPWEVAPDPDGSDGRMLAVSPHAPRGDDPADPSRPAESGRAAYTLLTREAGFNQLWVRRYWASPEADSLFAQVDGGPALLMTSSDHGRWGWSGVRLPKPLSAGHHVVELRNREPGVRVDRVVLVKAPEE
ncbi:MAG: hypothetical protein QHJ73_05030, partial [Armatimonadota bacterium]|nr:hypothetical protein [Armatimonadota bacterium]